MTNRIVIWPIAVALGFFTSVGILMPAQSKATEVYHTSLIKWVYPLADGSFVLTFTIDSSSCSSASSPKYQYVRVNENGMTEEGAKKIYAAALMAFAMGRQVSLAFSDSTSNCYINRLTVLE